MSRFLSVGILAHVDAGKTTCIESMLVASGVLKKAGRVDHQDAFLDYDQQERDRGITIYSKQAGFEWNDVRISVIDTPGHADFSAEMERSLSVLDAAIVLVSGLDGVQSHTKTIWKCLETYKIPTIVFVNKMDISRLSREQLLEDLKKNLSDSVIDLTSENWMEDFATQEESLLDEFLETGSLQDTSLQNAVALRKAFPVLYGSALKNDGIAELLDALTRFLPQPSWPEEFGARVFKITRDQTSVPLTHLKITGGQLHAKDVIGDQKVDQIRIYQGQGYQSVPSAQAGQIVTVKGLQDLKPGDGLGFEQSSDQVLLSPCLTYQLILPEGADPILMMGPLRQMMMEDPSLSIEFDERSQTISVRLMGEIQKEVLQKQIFDKTGFHTAFGNGTIVYKETITEPVFGYGHFEPLRHYAEVHLLIEPGRRNSGVTYSSKVSRDILSLNWQRLILSSLARRAHPGVLTGSALTDVRITLVAGRAHNKHTSGGDFRQASDRAVRQGLKKAENILLEPYFSFTVTTPSSALSRILFELENRKATVEVDAVDEESMQIRGRGPVRTLMNFQEDLRALSRGQASLAMENDGYDVCQDAEEIIESIGYQEELDRRNPSGSVFCVGGSGETIEWDEVEDWLHIPLPTRESVSSVSVNSGKVSEEELKRVFGQAGGANQNAKKSAAKAKHRKTELSMEPAQVTAARHLPTCLIVDGYNMIYSWPDLKDISRQSLHAAREELISRLVNYQGYKGWSLIVVFDGFRRGDNPGSSSRNGSSSIVYTPSGMSADSYIEKKVKDLRGKFECVAATSDALIQNSVFSHGARRISARELERMVSSVNQQAFSHLKP